MIINREAGRNTDRCRLTGARMKTLGLVCVSRLATVQYPVLITVSIGYRTT